MTDQPPTFSVIIPFLNEERWLPSCLQSLRCQTIDPALFEVICIDNGSTDRSAEIVRADPRVILLGERRRDPYLARNRGIAVAKGRHIAFLDADCVAHPDWLAEMWNEIRHSDASIVIGYLAYPRPISALLGLYEDYEDFKLRHILRAGLVNCYFGHAGNMVVRADIFAELGPFPPMPVVGDTEIIHRLLEKRPGAEVRYARLARVVHAEVESFWTCLAKTYETGGYSETLTRVSSYRILSLAERWRIFAGCAKEHGHGPVRRSALAAVLLLGWGAFFAGRMARKLSIGDRATVDPGTYGNRPAAS